LRGEADHWDRDGRAPDPWEEALAALSLLAVDPLGLGGALISGRPGPARDALLAHAARCATSRPLRIPAGADEAGLFGGLDLAATLAAGRPVRDSGLIARAAGRWLVLPMAERCDPGLAARLALALERGAGPLLALDEGRTDSEATPAALAERLAFRIDLDTIGRMEGEAGAPSDHAAARARLGQVAVPEATVARLTAIAACLGIDSLRAPLLAVRAARAAAALAGAAETDPDSEALAARLVLGPRARQMPDASETTDTARGWEAPGTDPPAVATSPEEHASSQSGTGQEGMRPDGAGPDGAGDRPSQGTGQADPPDGILLAAARAALPPGLLARLLAGIRPEARRRVAGAGAGAFDFRRGRPAGAVAARPRAGTRIALVETLRAAAPLQGPRRRLRPDAPRDRLLIARDDIRLRRYRRRPSRLAILVVDASGSQAVGRLAEAKGAVEILLADAYAGRDSVALVAFRGTGAELLLPPSRSVAAARRRLSALPGGGGTPLAAGLAAAHDVASGARQRGMVPTLALLTDGQANVARDGTPGRPRAEADALDEARRLRGAGLSAIVIDTGRRPGARARALAAAMDAAYLPLPGAEARALAGAVRAAAARA
jgi:magnesium chelatase subunit D